MRSEVRNKAQFYEMWEAGLLGNRTRIWRDPVKAFEWGRDRSNFRAWKNGRWDKPTGLPEIGFREIRPAGTPGAGRWQKVPWSQVIATAEEWRAEGRNFIMDDGAPDEYRTLQGEVVRTERGLEGFLDLEGKLPMRPAMAAGYMKHYGYLQTRLLLERYMDANSRDDLDMILDLFPDHAVEFSTFTVNVGVFPRRNTLFWEVRAY